MEGWHIERILSEIQEDQVWSVPYMRQIDAYAENLISAGPAYALVEGSEVWGCSGVCEIELHRAGAWALIHDDIGKRFFQFHKSVVSFLDDCGYARVELIAHDGHSKAERWAEMLGFEWEGCMQKYFPDGAMGNLYARVK